MSIGLTDYHMHTAVTVDARATEEECCQRAAALGLREICFTNHARLGDPDYTISFEAMAAHVRAIRVCQQRYPQVIIRLGLEMDYIEGREGDIAAMLRRYEEVAERPLDFVLGSIHYLHGIHFSSKACAPALYNNGHPIEALYRDYFAQMAQAASSGLFDAMAHPDLIKKYTHVYSPPVPFALYRNAVQRFVNAALASGVGLEVNTKGLKLEVNELYPSDDVLALYVSTAHARSLAPIITLGADSHLAENVGDLLPEGVRAIERAGHHALTGFEKRQPFAMGW